MNPTMEPDDPKKAETNEAESKRSASAAGPEEADSKGVILLPTRSQQSAQSASENSLRCPAGNC